MFQSGIKPLHFVAVRLRPSGKWESGGDNSWYWYWLLELYLPFRRKMMSSFCCQIVGWTSVVVTVAKKNPSSGQVLLLDCWLPQRVGRCDAIWTVLSEQGIKENSLCYSSLIWLPLSVNSFRWFSVVIFLWHWALCLSFCCSVVADSSAAPWNVALQAPLPMQISRQVYWSGEPFPSPGSLSNPEIEPRSPALAGRVFATEPRSPDPVERHWIHKTHLFWKHLRIFRAMRRGSQQLCL